MRYKCPCCSIYYTLDDDDTELGYFFSDANESYHNRYCYECENTVVVDELSEASKALHDWFDGGCK